VISDKMYSIRVIFLVPFYLFAFHLFVWSFFVKKHLWFRV
jgi:hypothetical protein